MDKEYAKILKQMLSGTNVQNTPEALNKSLSLHTWLDELISGERETQDMRAYKEPCSGA